MVAHGLAIRPELMLRAQSLGPEPAKLLPTEAGGWVTNPAYRPWVNSMNETTKAAAEAASAHAKATIGTSLHAIAERMDRGEDSLIVPDDYLPHLGSYAEATAGWEWLHIERFMVNDDLKIGGTPDRVARVPGHPRPVIADLKTGDVTYGVGKMAMQLAVYAHCQIYDPDGTRTPLPEDLDLDMGLIIALDALTGTCQILRIDIAAGWTAVQLARQVRAWRGYKGLTEPWRPTPSPTLSPEANRSLIEAIEAAESEEALTALWRSVDPSAWLDVHTQHAARRKRQLSA